MKDGSSPGDDSLGGSQSTLRLPPLRDARTTSVAVIGCGVVGRGWIPVFSRAGCHVRIYDPNLHDLGALEPWLTGIAAKDSPGGNHRAHAVTLHDSLREAVRGVGYIQESLPEDLHVKQHLFTQLDALTNGNAYLASSTSSLDINDIARYVRSPQRCFTAHPFNPAFVIPVVEVLGTRDTAPADLTTVINFLKHVGQLPVVLRRFAAGYIGNRLQAAVMREALTLVADGVTDADGIDTLTSHALALRWVALGIFGTNHTNDDRGLRGYYARFWQSYQDLMRTLASGAPNLDASVIASIGEAVERRYANASSTDVGLWRDEVVRQLREVQESAEIRRPGFTPPTPDSSADGADP